MYRFDICFGTAGEMYVIYWDFDRTDDQPSDCSWMIPNTQIED